MNIYLLDINDKMTDAWKEVFAPYFEDKENPVSIVTDDFQKFMDEHYEIDAVVSPANSYGIMDGGYDRAITEYFGSHLMKEVQKAIIDDWNGEQPVGTSISVIIRDEDGKPLLAKNKNGKYTFKGLIHTPTMRAPERIVDPRIVYQCMRTTLIEAKKCDVENIVIPAFGGATGGLPYNVIAKMMLAAYEQIFIDDHKSIDWSIVYDTSIKLKEAMGWQRKS